MFFFVFLIYFELNRWDRLQPPRNPTDGLSGYRKWMDGFFVEFGAVRNETFSLHFMPP